MITRAFARASGLKRYFTGRPCARGHIAERKIGSQACVECEKINANKASAKLTQKAWISRNTERVAAHKKNHYENNKEECKAAMRRWARDNKEVAVARASEWNKRNPESKRSSVRNRRARIQGIGGVHGKKDIDLLFKNQNGFCVTCRVDLSLGFHVDHIHPVSRGGSNGPENLQLLCSSCNQSKRDLTMDEWRASGLGVWGKLAG